RAGVHQQQIGLTRVVGRRKAYALPQYVRHAGGVVLVHLAAEGLDEVMAGHTGAGEFYGLGTRAARPCIEYEKRLCSQRVAIGPTGAAVLPPRLPGSGCEGGQVMRVLNRVGQHRRSVGLAAVSIPEISMES